MQPKYHLKIIVNSSFFYLLLCFFSIKSIAQTEADVSNTPSTSRPTYLVVSTGVQPSIFRDVATSPLFYIGNATHIALAHKDLDDKRESSFRLSYAFGDFHSKSAQEKTVSDVRIFALNYLEFFQLNKFSSSKVNLKIGGQLNTSAILRDNPTLGNNGDGFDLVATLFGSVKAMIDANRKTNKLPKKLTIGLHIGLINSSYRNGFIYTRQSPLLNQDNITDGYAFRLLSGFRLNSSVDYTISLRNRNALQLTYQWDAFRIGDKVAKFEMASHLLQASLLFNLK